MENSKPLLDMGTTTIPINPERVKGESFEQYKKRQRIVKKGIKQYLKGDMFHVSSVLVPLTSEDGKVMIGADKLPIWISRTKGRTFINKDKKSRKEKYVKK